MRCKRCHKYFEFKKGRKFCSDNCRDRYNAMKRYNRLKDNPEFKKYQFKKFNEWKMEHPLWWKELSRKGMNRFHARNRKKGLCECGKKIIQPQKILGIKHKIYKTCEKCREQRKEHYKKKHLNN